MRSLLETVRNRWQFTPHTLPRYQAEVKILLIMHFLTNSGVGTILDRTMYGAMAGEENATITTQPRSKRKELEQFVRDLDPIQVAGKCRAGP